MNRVGQTELFLQIFQQVDHLSLDGNIQRGNRLIADDQGRLKGQGAGNTNTLALTAGKFMRVAVGKSRVQTHQFEQSFSTVPGSPSAWQCRE